MPNLILQSLFAPKKRLLTLIVFCFFAIKGNSQNLILNGGFGNFNSAITIPPKVGYDSNYNQIAYNSGNSVPREFAITNNPGSVNTVNFKNLFDHTTGDGTGNMMVVDGDGDEVFWKQNPDRQLVGGQTYTFSYWIANVNKAENGANPAPKIRFNPQGCTSCSTQIYDLAGQSAGWNKVTYTITPATTQWVRIELTTVGAGGGGHDFAIDDISLTPPPPPLSISSSNTNPSCPTGNDGIIVAYPNGGLGPFTFTLAGTSSATNNTGIFQNLAGGTYTVSVTDSDSPASTETTNSITLTAPPDITLTESPTGCHLSGDAVTLTAANGNGTYSWIASPGGVLADTGSSITVNPTVTTTYTVSSSIVPPSVGNLIGNPGFENGTSGFYSDYGYSLTNTSGAQFAYGIVTNPSLWYNKFTTCTDKTTGTGNMLVADGATTANSVIWSQTVPVENSKTYDFSFWVQNIGDGVKATFEVLINGSPITISPISATNNVTAGTPATTTCNWTNITGTWASGGASLATIKIIDTNISGGGNDFAIDDLSFSTNSSKVCNLSKSLTVSIGGTLPLTTFTYPTPVCKNGTNPTPTGAVGFVTGGTYSSTSGLSINGTTGEIDLTTSTAGTYTVTYSVAANAATCQLAGSSTFDITINSQPIAGTDGSTTVCDNSVTAINLNSLITGEQIGGTWSRTTGSGGIFNAVAGTFTPAVGATTSTFSYTLLGTAPCVNDSSIATININATPNAGIDGSITVCESNITAINLFTLITGEQSSGTWTRATGTGGTFNAVSGTFSPAAGATTSTFTYTVTGTAPCLSDASVAAVNINTQPIAGTDGSTTVCDNSVTAINLYSLITGEQIGGAWSRTTGSGGIFNAAAGTFTPTVGATTSTFTYTLAGFAPCVNDSAIATVNINATPMLSINCGTSTATSVTFNWNTIADATSYSYSYNIESGTPVTGSVSSATTTYTVNGLTSGQVVAITITPVGSACGLSASGNCQALSCPLPTVDPIASIPVCSNQTVTVPSFTSNPAGATFNWFNNNTSIGLASNGIGNIPSFTAVNTTTTVQTATITVTANNGICTGPAITFDIIVNPLPTVSISGSTSVCSGTGTNIAFAGTPNAIVTYTLNSVTNTITLDAGGNATLGTGNITATASYDLVSALNPVTGCSQAQTGNATVTINGLPIASVSGSTSVCSGTGTNITFAGTPNAVVTYTLNSVSNTITLDAGGNATVATGNITATASYDLVSVFNSSTGCSQAQTGNATVTINALPIASVSGSTSVCSGTGTNITFVGTPNAVVTYTLNSVTNTVTLDAGGNANVATGNLTATASYDLVSVFNPFTGCSQAQTGNATVTINALPIASISGSTSVCSGTGTNITFAGTPNAIVTYTLNSVTNTITLDAGGNATVATGNITTPASYGLVSVLNTSTNCSQAQTGNATVTINALPIASVSGSTSVCSGTGTNITFAGTPNAVVTYTLNSVSNTITLDAGGNATVATGNITATASYDLMSVFNPATGCSQAQTGNATVIINKLPIASISGSTSVCSGTGTNITFVGTPNAVVTYTLNSVTNTITLDAGGNATVATGNLTATASYDLVSALNPVAGCSQAQTGNATVSINALPIATATPASQTICSGEQTGIVLSSTVPNTTFNWTIQSQVGATGAVAGSGNNIAQVLTATGITLGTVIYTITPTANGCIGNSIQVTIDVTPAPKATANPNSQSICSGDTTSFVLSSDLVGTTYDWNVVQTNVTGASAGSGTVISQVLTTVGNNAGQAVYTITPKLNGCYGAPISVVIDVNPIPVVSANPASETLCSGETTNIALSTTNVVGATFTWTVNQTGVTGASSGSGDMINQIVTATGPVQGTVDYTITPLKNGCAGVPVTVTVTVNPTPEVFGPASTTICSGESPNISLSPSIVGTTFEWIAVQSGVTGAADGSGDTINQILETSGTTQGSVIYRVTPTLNGCVGSSLDIKVLVNPLPLPELTDGVICVDQATNVAFQTYTLNTGLSSSSYNFEWYFENVLIAGVVSSSYEAALEGKYEVIATNKVTGCVSSPVSANVTASFPGESIATTQTPAFAEDATITVTVTGGNGTYEYKLDDGAFQTSNVFTNVTAGPHTVTVGDTNGCTNLSQDVFIIGYPKFFTPNGDGFNDSWNLVGLIDQPQAKIYIFDRYGKLLKQISSAGDGWDGTYTGQLMPATDYWFTVEYTELSATKIFRAHFSLLR